MNLKRRGQAAAVIMMGLLLAFIVALIYLVLNSGTDMVYDMVENSTAGSIGEETVPKVATYWHLWPIVALVAIFLFVMIGVLKSSYESPPY
jgi:4-hydroxybenzoate polyprenyltransferase